MSSKVNELDQKFHWIEDPETIGEMRFTFDDEKIYNLFHDYPHSLTPEEKEVFDKLNPFWVEFFKDREKH